MAGRETYDISATQKKILLEKHKRRTELRNEYLEKRLNPFRHAIGVGGNIEDPAVYRVMATRMTMMDRFKATSVSTLYYCGMLGIIGTIIYLGSRYKNGIEQDRRSGLVAYKDRTDKFV